MELKALENENCVISFSDAQEMQNALDQIMAGDSWHNVYAAKCRTSMDGEGIGILNTEAETVETGLIQREPKTYPMFSVAENTLSERSGSDASGNKFLNFEERLSVMNIYWAHHPEEEKCKLLVQLSAEFGASLGGNTIGGLAVVQHKGCGHGINLVQCILYGVEHFGIYLIRADNHSVGILNCIKQLSFLCIFLEEYEFIARSLDFCLDTIDSSCCEWLLCCN